MRILIGLCGTLVVRITIRRGLSLIALVVHARRLGDGDTGIGSSLRLPTDRRPYTDADEHRDDRATGADCRDGLAAQTPLNERVASHTEHDATDVLARAALSKCLAGRYGAVLLVGVIEGINHRRHDAHNVLVRKLRGDGARLTRLRHGGDDVLLRLVLRTYHDLWSLILRLRLTRVTDAFRPVHNLGLIHLHLVHVLKVLVLHHGLYPFRLWQPSGCSQPYIRVQVLYMTNCHAT